MRAVLDANGNHVMQDDAVRVEGRAAERMLADMERLDRDGHSAETRSFLADCERIFAATTRRSR